MNEILTILSSVLGTKAFADMKDELQDLSKQTLNDLKEINTILTEISKTSTLTANELKKLGDVSFDNASRFGLKASDYLANVQEMYRAGYTNAEQLAEVSMLAQSSGNLDAGLANDYLMASDAAYQYSGNVEKLTALLDAQNQVTNRNAVSMEDLANATIVSASQLAGSGIAENELTALLGTGIAATQEDGDAVGRAVNGILMNLQQIQGETGFGTEVLDAEALSKTEERCKSLGIELKTVENGITSLRDPMEILKELAEVYNALPDGSEQKAGILSDIGTKYRSNTLSAILSNWDLYEKMLQDFEHADGSALEETMKSADSWEGSMNRLSNTWTETIGNIANSDSVLTVVNSLNKLLQVIQSITEAVGPLGSLSLGAGLFAGLKNVGSPKMSGLTIV